MSGRVLKVEAGVSSTLPASVLLGTDVPELMTLLHEVEEEAVQAEELKVDEGMAVTTRAQTRRQREETDMLMQREATAGVQPRAILEELEQELEKEAGDHEPDGGQVFGAEFDQELFEGGRCRPKQSRRQKRAQRKKYAGQGERDEMEEELNRLRATELTVWQEEDETLQEVCKAADGDQSTTGEGFYRRDGVIYRRWTPPGQDAEAGAVEQLVLPQRCRETVLVMAHSVPMSGHLGKNKTAERLRRRFYWPTLFKDVAEYCRACEECQKCSSRRGPKAPLVPLPVMEEPFQRIAMDIVGPLPRSRLGNKYILVVCDYATRYPEAFALKSVDAEHVAEALVTMFAKVGVRKEILTDQGTNFTSRLLAGLYELLGVKAIKTSPYHPQTDGLVERFNSMLKSMLRKCMMEEGKDWDKLLPYVLFTYCEVPQTTTGFSPFELLYGRAVRGPVDVLKETWEASENTSDESVVSYILSVQEKLERMMETVKENSVKAKAQQKTWYNQNARSREFQPGDQVLVLLPTSTSKLLAQWQGPYPVIRRVGSVNYQIDMVGKRKRKRIFHVNMLQKWNIPTSTVFWAKEESPEAVHEEEDVVLWKDGDSNEEEPSYGEQLTGQHAIKAATARVS